MTHDELMKQSAKALLRWLEDDTLQVESCINADGDEWTVISNPTWNLRSSYFRIAEQPKVKRVPLGPEDFPPEQLHRVRFAGSDRGYSLIVGVEVNSVYTSKRNYTYEDLMASCERWVDGEWQPCWKEVTE